jgi:thiopeptide-type bacteriocin biosynthesis protein
MANMTTYSKNVLCDYACLRIPAKPVEDLLALNERIRQISLNSHESLVEILEDLFADLVFQLAIFTASRDLYYQFLNLKSSGYQDRKDTRKFFLTFYKYFSRMCTRPTPYGLFAGITSAKISGEPTNIEFDTDKLKPKCELNIHTVTTTIRTLNPLNKAFVSRVNYTGNKTIYTLGDRLFYVEQFNKGNYWASNLTSLRYTEFVRAALAAAMHGATLMEIAESLPDPQIDLGRKLAFVNSLIKAQVLVPEYWPSVSTDDYMYDFINYFREKQIPSEEIKELENAYNLTSNIDAVEKISALKDEISARKGARLYDEDFFKVNLFYNTTRSQVNIKPLQELCSIADEISFLFKPKISESLENFIRAFNAKYERAEIPLMQALDLNYGVGFGKVVNGFAEYLPLLEDVPMIQVNSQDVTLKRTILFSVQRRIFQKFTTTKQPVINIEDEIAKARTELDDQPIIQESHASKYIFGDLLADSPQSLDEGNYKFIPTQVYAPFANKLLSRFAHGDENLKRQVVDIAEHEQFLNGEAILAEVLTIPDDKYANICLSPAIRDYEIPFLSNSRLPADRQITVDDLLVSIQNGRIVLRSAKLNKEIIPCISNTYNTVLAQPAFKFLADVATQYMRLGDFWDWGQYYYTEKYLPRLEYKKFVIARARWNIGKATVDIRNEALLQMFISRLRQEFAIPQFVVLAQGDNELFLDLENPICQIILAKQAAVGDITLLESFISPDHCFIKEHGKGFTTEIVVPLLAGQPYYAKFFNREPGMIKAGTERIFPPGSEWLFVKIYSGSNNIEKVLTYVIGDFAKDLLQNGTADKWFFIRYDDPEYHLRVRFHKSPGASADSWFSIIPNLQVKLQEVIKEPFGFRMVIDTYVREIERYDAKNMDYSESVFCADSIAIAEFNSLLSGNEGEALRWKFAFVNIDCMLTDFGYSVTAKKKLIEGISNDFLQEFGHRKKENVTLLIKALNEKYRKYRKEIAEFVAQKNIDQFKEAYDCFDRRSDFIKEDIEMIKQSGGEQPDNLLTSYIHMSMNRLFIINQRRHELVIYYLLAKHYEEVIIKAKQLQL